MREFLRDQHANMLEAFMLPEDEDISDPSDSFVSSEDSDLGSIEVSSKCTKERPYEGYFEFTLTYPKNGPIGGGLNDSAPYQEEIQAQKIGFLFEQFTSVLFEYSESFTRSYED